MTDLAKGAGVSLDILKKLKTRPNASTNAETAVKIAAFYRKSVADFMKCETSEPPEDKENDIAFLFGELDDKDQESILRQIRGLLSLHG